MINRACDESPRRRPSAAVLSATAVLSASAVLSAFAACAPLAAAEPEVVMAVPAPGTTNTVLERAAQAPVIDGKLDDACWQGAALPIDQPNGPDQPRAVPVPASVRYAWDEHYLYLAYETSDRNLVALGSKERQGPAGNQRDGCTIWDPVQKVDVVEFFIGTGDPHFFWELHHNALNQFNDVWCVVTDPTWPIHRAALNPYGILFSDHEYLQDDGEYTFASAVVLKPKADGTPSTVGGDDVDTGYCAELRIPWFSLGLPKERMVPKAPGTWRLDGFTLAVLAVVQDGDLKQRYYRSGSFGTSSWFHHDMPVWPRYTLHDAAAAGK